MPLGAEDRLLQWLRAKLREKGFDRLGDDAAVLPGDGSWAVSMDHQIAGVHFPADLAPAQIARRALAVNLSDLAAMGAEPIYTFLALSCPPSFSARRFLASLLASCHQFGVELAGGDLARHSDVTVVLTVVGRRVKGGRWVSRRAARPGDRIWLGGSTGLAALGRVLIEQGVSPAAPRHRLPARLAQEETTARLCRRAVQRQLAPRPQLELGRWLAKRRRAAAIDISDGLALDLHRLCRESGVGADLWEASLPVEAGFAEACAKLGLDAEQLLLGGGDDYVLLFTLSPRIQPPAAFCCHPVGRITEGRRLRLIQQAGSHPLPAIGWDHFR